MSYSASRRSFAPVSLVALSLALAGGGCSGESATNGGSAPDNTGASFGGTGRVVTCTGGAPAGGGGGTRGRESVAGRGDTNTRGTGGTEEAADANRPTQAAPGA